MEVIYQNFDALEVSFQGAIPAHIRHSLFHAKKKAIATKAAAFAELGPKKLPVMVHETGAKGGYTYQFSTGLDGEIWLIADSSNVDFWNIRVRVRSLCIALNGYEKTKEKLLKILLRDLLAKGPKDNERKPQERISRVDYCIDFLILGGFIPNYSNFVCCGTTKKRQIGDIPYDQNSTGQKIDTLMVGKMPNRQIVIYNKIKEITAKSKKYWFKIWGLNETAIIGQIWRVEIRAGKKELNKWNLRSFSDFEKKIGNVITETLNAYKYTQPNFNDSNQSRWPLAGIWKMALEAIKGDLFAYFSKAQRNDVLKEIQELAALRYEKYISGIVVGYTAALGKDISEIPRVMEFISGQVLEDMANNPEKFRQKHKKVVSKFL